MVNNKKYFNRRLQNGTQLKDVMSVALSQLSQAQKDPISSIELVWSLVCGDELAAQVRPKAMVQNILHVESRDATWSTAFSQVESGILYRLRSICGPVAAIRLTEAVTWQANRRHLPDKDKTFDKTESQPSENVETAIERLLASRRHGSSETS
jgi:hypothetical protein